LAGQIIARFLFFEGRKTEGRRRKGRKEEKKGRKGNESQDRLLFRLRSRGTGKV